MKKEKVSIGANTSWYNSGKKLFLRTHLRCGSLYMSTMVFVNFPVKDLTVSTAFYEALGFKKNPMFSDKAASCMAWDDHFIVMLLSHER